MSSNRNYLGRVRDVRISFGTYHYARVEPLLESDERGSKWVGVIHDLIAEFPAHGRAYWHDAPTTLQHGSLWQFEVEEHPTGRNDGTKDLWQVTSETSPVEIVDVRSWEMDALRVALTGFGLPIARPPIAEHIALWIDDDHLLGRVRFKRAADQQGWILDMENPSRVPVWRTPRSHINEVELEGDRLFLAPSLDLGEPAEPLNWSSDEEIARTVLKRLRKFDRGAADALQVTDAVFARYVQMLTDAGFLGSSGQIDRAHVSRVSALRSVLVKDAALLEAAAETLLRTPAVSKRVDDLVIERVAEQVAAKSSELDHELAERSTALMEMRSAVESLSEQRDTLITKIDAKQQEIKTAMADHKQKLADLNEDVRLRTSKFEDALADRLRVVAERPAAAFAELAVIRAALNTSAAQNGMADGHSPVVSIRPISIPPLALANDISELSSPTELQSKLMQHALWRGLNPASVFECHAACAANGFPIIVGDRAEDVVQAYASTLAGGRVLWVPVGASVLEPQQLLGFVDPQLHRFIPHANGLVEVLVGAQQSDDVFIVAFDGINRAPAETWLIPFLTAMSAARRTQMDRGVPLIAPGSVAVDDPYGSISRLQWPRNVLPIGLVARGSATLPLSTDLWRFSAVIDADRIASIDSVAVNPSRVTATQWRAWQDAEVLPSEADIITADGIAKALPSGTRSLDIAMRMATLFRARGLMSSDITMHAFVPTLVPRFASIRDDLENRAVELGLGAPDAWRTVLDIATQLWEP